MPALEPVLCVSTVKKLEVIQENWYQARHSDQWCTGHLAPHCWAGQTLLLAPDRHSFLSKDHHHQLSKLKCRIISTCSKTVDSIYIDSIYIIYIIINRGSTLNLVCMHVVGLYWVPLCSAHVMLVMYVIGQYHSISFRTSLVLIGSVIQIGLFIIGHFVENIIKVILIRPSCRRLAISTHVVSTPVANITRKCWWLQFSQHI